MRFYFLLLLLLPVSSFGQRAKENASAFRLNKIAKDYVRLGLAIGQYDGDFVDAYYGPDSLKPTTAKQSFFPKDSFLKAVNNLQIQLTAFIRTNKDVSLKNRARWISTQLTAFSGRMKMFAGEQSSFDQQAKELFGVEPPTFDEGHFRSLVKQLQSILPEIGRAHV